MVTAVLISGQHFSSTVTREVKCTTVNGVHVCFCGWCRCRAKGVCERNILIKEIRKPIKKKKKEKFIDWYVYPIIRVMSIVNRVFVTSAFFSCIQCFAAPHATWGQLSALMSQGDRWKKGGRWKENRFHSSLAGGFWEQQEQLITARTEGGSY